MRGYVIRRLLLLVVIVFGVSVIIFIVMRVAPGDIVNAMVAASEGGTGRGLTPERIEKVRAQLGLDKPLYLQYLDWLWGVVRLNPGMSFWTNEPVMKELKHAWPITIELALLSFIIAMIIALFSGILSALRQDTWVDYAFRVFTIAGLAFPAFWVGIVLILFLALYLDYMPPLRYTPFTENPWENIQQFIFPALVLGWRAAAITGRMVRSSMLEVLREDYVRTAWAKGLRERVIIYRHALKNAALPVVTLAGFQLAYLLGGVVVIESVFSLPGVGRALVVAINHRDYPIIQFIIPIFAFITAFSNLAVDLLYAWLDPRVRYA
jgi:peptide/nickel transport system permease protein